VWKDVHLKVSISSGIMSLPPKPNPLLNFVPKLPPFLVFVVFGGFVFPYAFKKLGIRQEKPHNEFSILSLGRTRP
jgi:hypothetical protein